MSQSHPSSGSSVLPPELRIDLIELAEDLLGYQLENGVSAPVNNSAELVSETGSISTPSQTALNPEELVRHINRIRTALQRAQETARKLTSCDLDLEAQEKLLLALSTSCITKRQLICLLKRELSKFSKDSSMVDVPAEWDSCISRKVRLRCKNDKVFEGFVYTVDPKSGNFVLLQTDRDPPLLAIVCSWAIKGIEILESELPSDVSELFQSLPDRLNQGTLRTNPASADTVVSSEVVQQRRERLIEMFKSDGIELIEVEPGVFSVNDVVFIEPPYSVESCSGKNVLVLDRVKKLVMTL
ncbi:unnamed protein product [Calicophoron daubneyi]|uniref:AD domain-containing protein n=1 Tax=Calicophoron daubneyi TaxID=300641 RepID=A0AAV2TU72_CALDB